MSGFYSSSAVMGESDQTDRSQSKVILFDLNDKLIHIEPEDHSLGEN